MYDLCRFVGPVTEKSQTMYIVCKLSIAIRTCYHNCAVIPKGSDRPSLAEINSCGIRDGVATVWYDLGLELIPDYQNQLDIIKNDNPTNAKTCCREMFQYWLQVNTKASWDKLIVALKKINKNQLAATIREKILQGN